MRVHLYIRDPDTSSATLLKESMTVSTVEHRLYLIDIFPNVGTSTFPVSVIDADTSDFLTTSSSTTIGSWSESDIRSQYITDVGEAGYQIIQSIPCTIHRLNDADFLATIEVANIAITGTDWHDAYQALITTLLDTFDALLAEANLGADAAAQLAVLNTYLVKA